MDRWNDLGPLEQVVLARNPAVSYAGTSLKGVRVREITILSLFFAALGVACSGSQRDDTTPDALEGGDEESEREARELRGSCERGEREATYDLNHDGATDIREVYEDDQIVCRETDLNFDGRVDVFRYFEGGRQRREEMDLDRDGRLDLVGIFDSSGQHLTREEYDTNYDSRIDVWRYFQGESVQRVERDSDHDGRADVWTHCSGGRATRIEYDTTGDGEPDSNEEVGDGESNSECTSGVLAGGGADSGDAEEG